MPAQRRAAPRECRRLRIIRSALAARERSEAAAAAATAPTAAWSAVELGKGCVTFSFLRPLLEKYGTFIARCNALIEKVSSFRVQPGQGPGQKASDLGHKPAGPAGARGHPGGHPSPSLHSGRVQRAHPTLRRTWTAAAGVLSIRLTAARIDPSANAPDLHRRPPLE
eukprot:SAG31_NODE_11363_length_1038_cov_3.144835_1_plen_167_part_00